MTTPEITHTIKCTDPTIRSSESIWDRTIVTHRCLGCGVVVKVAKQVTK